MGFLTLNQTSSWMVASKLQKRSLLIAVNGLAGMSIFFFGYDPTIRPGNEAQTNPTLRVNLHLMNGGDLSVISICLGYV